MELVSLVGIQSARARIESSIHVSPCQFSHHLSELTGQKIYLKLENLQRTGAFKERGALNKILLLQPGRAKAGSDRGLAGNHAQAVACHATKHGIRTTIVMPAATPLVKVMATQNYGADVILHGANYDEACDHALEVAAQRGLTFLHPFDDHAVIAGQGTIGLELLDQCPATRGGRGADRRRRADCGSGGSRQGDAAGGEDRGSADGAAAFDDVGRNAWWAGDSVPTASTIADGIAVRRVGEITFPLVARYVDEIVTVEEEEIASAILTLLEREKLWRRARARRRPRHAATQDRTGCAAHGCAGMRRQYRCFAAEPDHRTRAGERWAPGADPRIFAGPSGRAGGAFVGDSRGKKRTLSSCNSTGRITG